MTQQHVVALQFKGLNIPQLTVLNLGCGDCSSEAARSLKDLPFKKFIGVDIWPAEIDLIRKTSFAAVETEFRCEDILQVPHDAYGTVDVTVLLDVVEHLPQEALDGFLTWIEEITIQRVIVLSPIEPEGWHANYTLVPRPVTQENPYQQHISWLTPELFEARGYEVTIMQGFHHTEGRSYDALWAIKECGHDSRGTEAVA